MVISCSVTDEDYDNLGDGQDYVTFLKTRLEDYVNSFGDDPVFEVDGELVFSYEDALTKAGWVK